MGLVSVHTTSENNQSPGLPSRLSDWSGAAMQVDVVEIITDMINQFIMRLPTSQLAIVVHIVM